MWGRSQHGWLDGWPRSRKVLSVLLPQQPGQVKAGHPRDAKPAPASQGERARPTAPRSGSRASPFHARSLQRRLLPLPRPVPPSGSPAAANVRNYRRFSRFLLCGWNNDSLPFYYRSNGFTFGIAVVLLILARGVLFSIGRACAYITSRADGRADRLTKPPRHVAEPLQDAA